MTFDYTAPKDVFPRRNLGAGEPWGRAMEDRTIETEFTLHRISQSLKGQNRSAASSLEQLARQLKELEDLYLSVPQVKQSTNSSSGWGLASGWNTVVTDTISVPDGMSTATVRTDGVLWMRADMGAGTLIQAQSRIVISGTAGPSFNTSADAYDPGLGATNAPQFSRTFGVSPGGSFSVSLQINPASAPAFPADSDNYSVVTTLVSFTG